ncbi:MAG: hypothetical protein KGM43_13655, partial [Planctomycetota bacterium]|nr:hypothetical protein [Planctomycetota bacterium]
RRFVHAASDVAVHVRHGSRPWGQILDASTPRAGRLASIDRARYTDRRERSTPTATEDPRDPVVTIATIITQVPPAKRRITTE